MKVADNAVFLPHSVDQAVLIRTALATADVAGKLFLTVDQIATRYGMPRTTAAKFAEAFAYGLLNGAYRITPAFVDQLKEYRRPFRVRALETADGSPLDPRSLCACADPEPTLTVSESPALPPGAFTSLAGVPAVALLAELDRRLKKAEALRAAVVDLV